MTFLVMTASALIAWVAQWMNARKAFPTPIIKLVTAAIGIVIYGLVKSPTAWTGQPFLDWLDGAWIWALAIPGASAIIAIHPDYKTDAK